jgi:aspartyl-tRNA(Asn)/glutamyl-tRNA(Gln) amidotransferase subunit A
MEMTMSAADELCYLSIAELERAYADRRLSPVEVTEAYLDRIEALDGRLNSYITVTAEAARAAARSSEQRRASGRPLGPLDGVPVALKDLYDTAGIRTTAHSPLYAERVPETDATVVRRLNSAGVILLGKLAMHEFASGGPELDAIFPPARNPWDTDRVPAGSSSGSGAALAAGLAAGSFGSDTGGSIRGPASYCGIVGLKPTYGLVSRSGVIPMSWTLDHAGPMARTVKDTAMLLQAVAGHDPADPASALAEVPDFRVHLAEGIAGRRVGAPLAAVEAAGDLHPETLAAFRQALSSLEQLGASIQSIELPDHVQAAAVWLVIASAEAFAFHERDAREQPEKFGRRFFASMLQGALYSASDYIQALRGRALICQEMGNVMRLVDLIVLPTTPHPAMDFATELASPFFKRTSFTRLFSLTGQPAISLPCGFSADRLPIGLQIAGRPFKDHTVLAAAHAYEQANDWYRQRPPIT